MYKCLWENLLQVLFTVTVCCISAMKSKLAKHQCLTKQTLIHSVENKCYLQSLKHGPIDNFGMAQNKMSKLVWGPRLFTGSYWKG